jgi:hypothetical protein
LIFSLKSRAIGGRWKDREGDGEINRLFKRVFHSSSTNVRCNPLCVSYACTPYTRFI